MKRALVDLDGLDEVVTPLPRPPIAEDTLAAPEVRPYAGVTIKASSFKAKIRFDWSERAEGANTLYGARCRICRAPVWFAFDYQTTQLRVMTAAHKDKHYWAATSNTPTSLNEGALTC